MSSRCRTCIVSRPGNPGRGDCHSVMKSATGWSSEATCPSAIARPTAITVMGLASERPTISVSASAPLNQAASSIRPLRQMIKAWLLRAAA